MQDYNPFMHNYWVKWKRGFGGGGDMVEGYSKEWQLDV